MKTWKTISYIIRGLVVANLTLIAGVLLFQGSRPIAIKVFWAFKASTLALLPLVLAEFILRRTHGAKGYGLIVDTLLTVVMLGVWFTISAATF
jgi:hypothetical protein